MANTGDYLYRQESITEPNRVGTLRFYEWADNLRRDIDNTASEIIIIEAGAAKVVVNVNITTADSPYTVVNDYERVFVNAENGAVTVVFKAISTDQYVDVVKVDSGSSTVTLSSTDLINGETSQILYYQYESAECASSGSEWVVI